MLGISALLSAGCTASNPTGSQGTGSAAGSTDDAASSDTAAFRNTDLGCDLGEPQPVELAYAQQFTLDTYEGRYQLACLASGERYLIVPAGATAPDGLATDVVALQQPLDNVYLVSTGMICLLDELDALGAVTLVSVTPETSPNERLTQLIEAGAVAYGGRYRDPDFELVTATGCTLAIENTQIHRYPDIKRKLEELGVAVLTEQSSTEDTVLGRLEWIRLIGALFDRADKAAAFFDDAVRRVQEAESHEPSDASVVFFYLDDDGAAVVRRAGDYFQQMIELAGGTCITFDRDPEADASSTTYITVEMESFYAAAKDADVVIYNATVDESVASIADLVARNDLLADFKAVQSGAVYTCDSNLYQQMTATPAIIEELEAVLAGDGADGTFIWRLA